MPDRRHKSTNDHKYATQIPHKRHASIHRNSMSAALPRREPAVFRPAGAQGRDADSPAVVPASPTRPQRSGPDDQARQVLAFLSLSTPLRAQHDAGRCSGIASSPHRIRRTAIVHWFDTSIPPLIRRHTMHAVCAMKSVAIRQLTTLAMGRLGCAGGIPDHGISTKTPTGLHSPVHLANQYRP